MTLLTQWISYGSLSKLAIHNRLICTRTGIRKYQILCKSLFPLDKEEISLVNNSEPQENGFKTILSYCQLQHIHVPSTCKSGRQGYCRQLLCVRLGASRIWGNENKQDMAQLKVLSPFGDEIKGET